MLGRPTFSATNEQYIRRIPALKYNEKNHIEIQAAALVLSSLNQADRLEMHTLDGALLLLEDDMDEIEQVHAIMALSSLIHAMMQDMSTRHREDEPKDDDICVDDTVDGGLGVSIGDTDLLNCPAVCWKHWRSADSLPKSS